MTCYLRYTEGMYIATVPNRNSPPALLLRESFRQNGKVKNRTLANLTHWPAARIEALRRLLRGEFDQAADLSVVRDDLSSQQVHDSYLSLGKVERDFRTLKTGLLEVRPVWVRKESRTRGHVFCCLLALKVAREMERRLRAALGTTETRADALTLPDALLALTRLCLLHYPVDEKTMVTKLPQPDARQRQILQALGVTLPAM
jgi:transposase